MQSSSLLISILVMGSFMAVALGIRARRSRRDIVLSAALGGNSTTFGTAPPDIRDIELSRPWTDRILGPILGRLTSIGRILTPSRNLAQLQKDLIRSGLADKLSVPDFLGLRFLTGATIAAIFAFSTVAYRPLGSALWFILSAFVVGLYLPNIWLRGRVRRRKTTLSRALPDALDMMSICVDAGLGFEAAIQKVAYQWDTELSLELRRVISEIAVGVSRVDALRHMVDRTDVPEVASFVAVLVQADQLGISIRTVLKTQADQMRVRRRQLAEEAAHRAPLKMLFPMVFFIFPAMFLIILGPAIVRVYATFY